MIFVVKYDFLFIPSGSLLLITTICEYIVAYMLLKHKCSQKNTFFHKMCICSHTHGHISKIWLIIGLIQGDKLCSCPPIDQGCSIDSTAQTDEHWGLFL